MEARTEEIILSVARRHNEVTKKLKGEIKRYGVSNVYLIRFSELDKRGNTGNQFRKITMENFSIINGSLKSKAHTNC